MAISIYSILFKCRVLQQIVNGSIKFNSEICQKKKDLSSLDNILITIEPISIRLNYHKAYYSSGQNIVVFIAT